MDKEALIKIILSDLSEVETMVKSFQGNQEIPPAFINLTEQKLVHLKDEFSLLKSLTTNHSQPISKEKEETMDKIKVEEKPEDNSIHASEVIKETVGTAPESPEPSTEEIIEDSVVETIEIKEDEEVVVNESQQTETSTIVDQPIKVPTPQKETKEENTKTLGESFAGEKKSVNDFMASSHETKIKSPLMGKPIRDLTKGLGINDRFMFQRELFNGKSDVMQQTLQQLNQMTNLESAQSFLASNFNWDNELEVTQSFYNYIKRKFQL